MFTNWIERVVTRGPIATATADDIIGYVVRSPMGGTFFVQRKNVLSGAAVNYGINVRHLWAAERTP